MKYMTKPSLFSDKDKQGNDKIFSQVPSYREHIEIQKKKAAERDERYTYVFVLARIDHFANANFCSKSVPLWGLKVITRSNFGSLIQQKHCIYPRQRNGSSQNLD